MVEEVGLLALAATLDDEGDDDDGSDVFFTTVCDLEEGPIDRVAKGTAGDEAFVSAAALLLPAIVVVLAGTGRPPVAAVAVLTPVP